MKLTGCFFQDPSEDMQRNADSGSLIRTLKAVVEACASFPLVWRISGETQFFDSIIRLQATGKI